MYVCAWIISRLKKNGQNIISISLTVKERERPSGLLQVNVDPVGYLAADCEPQHTEMFPCTAATACDSLPIVEGSLSCDVSLGKPYNIYYM